jgi:hypothetical protein
MTSEATRRAVDAAIVPLVASLGPWGVHEGHWLPGRDGHPVLWFRTRTEAEARALQGQVWLVAQVQVVLQRVGVPPTDVARVGLQFSSGQAEARLFEE